MFIWFLVFGVFVFFFRPTHKWPELDRIPLLDMHTFTAFLLPFWLLIWLTNPSAKRLRGNILTLAMLLYTLVIVVSVLASPYTGFFANYWCQAWLRFMVFFVVLVTSVKTERDLKIIVTAVSVVFFLEMAHIYLSGYTTTSASVERLAVETGRFARVTQLGVGVACMLPLIFPVVTLCKRYWHYLFILGYVLLTVRIVTLTGTRTALLMLVAPAICATLFSRYRFRILPLLLLISLGGWFALPENMQNRYRSIWDPTVDQAATRSAEARISGFDVGMEDWAAHPVLGTGVVSGPTPGLRDSERLVGVGVHSLYAQVPADLGTVGIATFLFLLSCFGINHYSLWRNFKYLQEKNLGNEGLYCWRVSLASIYGAVMMLIMGFGEANAYYSYWIWFAAFQALAAMLMQEKVHAAMQGKLLPSLPMRK